MSMLTTVVQRVRLTFSVSWPLQYVSILDMGRLWERLMRRANMPLTYTRGYNPHARLQFADALPVGYTSDCELLDVYLGREVDVKTLPTLLQPFAPPGLVIADATEVEVGAKAPQALMRAAVYRVSLRTEADATTIGAALDDILARTNIPVQRERRGRIRTHDLRELVYELDYLNGAPPWHDVRMRLRCGSRGSGRPAEVLDATGLAISDIRVHRTQLIWDEQEERPS